MRGWRLSGTARQWLWLGLAAAAGLLAAWSAARHIQAKVQDLESQARVPTVFALVADDDLPQGTRLHAALLALREFPQQWVSADALPDEALDLLEGKTLAHAVRRGEPILPAHLAEPRPQALSARLAPGRRAVSVAVADLNLQPGLLAPDDKLDLYVSFQSEGANVTAPLLLGARVIAVGGWQDLPGMQAQSGSDTVTFDLEPADAVKLLTARDTAALTALLRHPDDATQERAAAGGDLAALLGMPRPQPPRPAPVVLYGDAPGLAEPDMEAGHAGPAGPLRGWFDAPAFGLAHGRGAGPSGARQGSGR
ncbi:Flp pilus assembly protein CpaB [Orrella sp. JC864]|uniref:Flp pilus assembly protein CpaB n=1 Tax=Orrella sp. JC864 TaxID=3120298 RepID=UPI00300B1147